MGNFTSEPNVTRIAPVADIHCATCPSVGHVYPRAVIQQKRRVETKGAMENMRTRSREATERALRKFHQSSNNNLSMGASISEVREFQAQASNRYTSGKNGHRCWSVAFTFTPLWHDKSVLTLRKSIGQIADVGVI